MDISSRDTQEQRIYIPGLGFILGFGAFCVIGAVLFYLLVSTRTVPVLPDQASLQSRNTDSLFYLLVLIGSFVFFLVQGLLVYSVYKFRARPNDTADGPNVHGNATLEIIWTVIPSIVIAVLGVLSVWVWNNNNAVLADDNLVNGRSVPIHVTAQRFAWLFEYQTGEKDINDKDIVLKGSSLHTYVGQSVRLTMNTLDVIHSFWIPAVRVKQDVIPGRTTEFRFNPVEMNLPYEFVELIGTGEDGTTLYLEASADSEAVFNLKQNDTLEARRRATDESGAWTQVELVDSRLAWVESAAIGGQMHRYRIVCAELCGGGHGQMFAYLYIHETEESFLSWYSANLERLRVPPNDPVELGRQVLTSGAYPCANCHTLTSLGWQGITGPNQNGIADRAGNRAAASGADSGADYIMHSLRQPQDYLVPGSWGAQMPAFLAEGELNFMSEDDLIGITAYLCTQTATGNPQDNTCGLEFGDDGALVDVDAALEYLRGLAAKYNP